MGEHSTADDMLDRCLYAFEMAWHHSFNIANANCMLDPEREENKGFFEALFRHLQVLVSCCLKLQAPGTFFHGMGAGTAQQYVHSPDNTKYYSLCCGRG